MKKLVLGIMATVALTAGPAAAAGASAPANDHNCVGAIDSSLAGPGFGAVVSGIATSAPGAIAASLSTACGVGHA